MPAEGRAYLARETAMASRCSAVLTFDKAILQSEGIEEPH
jgi:hypothetical protein